MGEARIVTINGGWPIQSRSVRLSGVAMQPAIPISRSPSRAHLRRKEHGEVTGLLSRQASPFHCLQLLSSPATVVHPLIQKVNLKGSGQECPLHTPHTRPHPRRDREKSRPNVAKNAPFRMCAWQQRPT